MSGVREAFNRLVYSVDYPMLIVTARAGDERVGCVVGFATQASIDPPRFLVCLSHTNRTYRVAADAERFAVHWIPADRPDLAELFGGQTGDEVDKFAATGWHDGPGGVPILDACPSWMVGRRIARVDAGDHDAVLLEPVAAVHAEGEVLSFQRAKAIEPGHAP